MSETTPSQAEGERDEEERFTEPDRTTPSQAEGERDEEEDQASADGGDEQP
ncbi:hypothetical protein ACIF80_23555 [Streptomyces sp. NPDC085927]|uniref:hypothetical protein n=1 Tax=Streptomyces sp. NPDC085927 TaxID=3365738 RepID=UPI0037D64BDE